MQAILIQPPFVQLNTPYPAVYYLESFLKGRGVEARSYDHSIAVYRRLFSREGLGQVFEAVEAKDLSALGPEVEVEVARYRSYRDLYLQWVDALVDFLSGKDPGLAHRLAAAAELPRGPRAAAFLEASGGRIGADQAQLLATRILEDLADLVTYVLDPDFATVRYGDRLARSQGDFGEVLLALEEAWFLREVYRPWLRAFWAERLAEGFGAGSDGDWVLLSVPFPGCLAGALACAQEARRALGSGCAIVLGGGYVSTELRHLADPRIFDLVDHLAFDSGYGALAALLEGGPAYRTLSRGPDGRVEARGFGEGPEETRYAALERRAHEEVFPDYASVDFGDYLGATDSANPMHRLWSDTPWLKFSLAHGCYWRKCAFCDTQLDYVAAFVPAKVDRVFAAAARAADSHGLYGIHFVDEALPMAGLLGFAARNRARAASGGRPLHFWGNVRFDASWTQDRCEYLAASGLVAVSGGIEIATEAGLAMTDKGFDLPSLVRTLVAMRRAGLLVHAYLIYGFPGQPKGDIVDSAEVTRQLFASGLVDSAFWHRFVLTRHSTLMAEHQAGRAPDLRPRDRRGSFADNDLEFEGEAAYDEFDAPLAEALAAWMEGRDLEAPLRRGLLSRGRTVDPGLVEDLVEAAEAALDLEKARPPAGRPAWVGGRPLFGTKGSRLTWAYRGELLALEGRGAPGGTLATALEGLASLAVPGGVPGTAPARAEDFLAQAGLEPSSPDLLALREGGLLFL